MRASEDRQDGGLGEVEAVEELEQPFGGGFEGVRERRDEGVFGRRRRRGEELIEVGHRRWVMWSLAGIAVVGFACGDARMDSPDVIHDAEDEGEVEDTSEGEDDVEEEVPSGETVLVEVTLDGVGVADAVVVQGGVPGQTRTGPDGRARVPVVVLAEGAVVMHASHPEARIGAVVIEGPEPASGVWRVELTRFGADNPSARFADPGEPFRRPDTGQCSHCHVTIGDDWYGSVHRRAASNPLVWDEVLGTAHRASSEEACEALGGVWGAGPVPGGGIGERCEVAEGADRGCADCHAPGIDGVTGGRSMMEAEGLAFAYGVHCDVCHKVESVWPGASPGVGGWLRVHRPSEPAPEALGGGGWRPLHFGPSHDVANPRMGMVQRDHFRDSSMCGGCHEHWAEVGVSAVWPEGRIPLQTTWSEWSSGPFGGIAGCVDCHMPPDASVANGADLQMFWPLTEVGIQGGWPRPPGEVRSHAFVGPRTQGVGMVELAVSLGVVATSLGEDTWDVRMRVRNAGAGHAVPTGVAMRSLVGEVEVWCEGERQPAVGGMVVPSWSGYEERAEETWRGMGWMEGDVLRVVARGEGWHTYKGVAPFRSEERSGEALGMRREEPVGAWQWRDGSWEGIEGSGRNPPDGEEGLVFYRIVAPWQRAGRPGFAWARVLVGAGGEEMVGSHEAVDVRSDNRIGPREEVETEHRFRVACASPEVRARLWYVPYSARRMRERGWEDASRVVARSRWSR